MIHNVVIHEKPPSKRPRKQSSSLILCKALLAASRFGRCLNVSALLSDACLSWIWSSCLSCLLSVSLEHSIGYSRFRERLIIRLDASILAARICSSKLVISSVIFPIRQFPLGKSSIMITTSSIWAGYCDLILASMSRVCVLSRRLIRYSSL